MAQAQTKYRICPICEAACNLEITISGKEVLGIRGDSQDLLSQGYICPKGVALKELHTDPDRLRQPLVRRNGVLKPASWEEAFAVINERLPAIHATHGASAVAIYGGTPAAHNFGVGLGAASFGMAVNTPNIFTAASVDQLPKNLTSGLMFGDPTSFAVPDIDRCDYLLMLGANPIVSNGSMWIVPNFRGRLKEMQARNGKLVVIDPRRTETAMVADDHHFIRPGADTYFLLALLHVMFRDGIAAPGPLLEHVAGYDDIATIAGRVDLAAMSAHCGISVGAIEGMARTLAQTERAAVYGRMGTTTQKHGSLASWLIDVVNVVAGNLDRPGGAMFGRAPAFASNTQGRPGSGTGFQIDRYRTRVAGHPEVRGQFPLAALAEEIETEGEGRVRALVCICGNPARSAPNGSHLEAALGKLDFMLAIDIYLGETAQHADVVLPGAPVFEKGHFEYYSGSNVTRNVARYSPPIFDSPDEFYSEWEIMLQLTAIMRGMGVVARADLATIEETVVRSMIVAACDDPFSVAHGQDVEQALAATRAHKGPERLVDVALRTGAYGDGFGAKPGGLSLASLLAAPHSIDLGPLTPRIPEVLRTPSGRIELAPDLLLDEVTDLLDRTSTEPAPEFLLVGRRQVRSNNSWMHNLRTLVKGPFRCTLMVNPDDAIRLGLADGALARVSSRVGSIEAQVEISDSMMPGVVSMPHGWGHDASDARLAVAAERPGVSANRITDDADLETLTGNAVFNGVPVSIAPVPTFAPAA